MVPYKYDGDDGENHNCPSLLSCLLGFDDIGFILVQIQKRVNLCSGC